MLHPLEDDIQRIKETLKNVGQQSASTAQKVNAIGWGEYQGGVKNLLVKT